jgi:2-methylisocitrate lyase-like PEP mutase family enzyme
VATSSLAIAETLGYTDHEGAPANEMLSAAARIARVVSVPITVDTEAGYGLEPADLVARLLAMGVHGCNLEDSDHRNGGLTDAVSQSEYIREMRGAIDAARSDLVINARVDVFTQGQSEPEDCIAEATRRGQLYLEAGADCIFPIFASEEQTIADLIAGIDGPVNILYQPDKTDLTKLARLGVARISYGPFPYWAAKKTHEQVLQDIVAGRNIPLIQS